MTHGPHGNLLKFARPTDATPSVAERAEALRSAIAEPDELGYRPDRSLEIVLQELETVLENIEYGVFLMDAEMRAQMMNHAFREMWQVDNRFAKTKPDFFEMIEYLRDRGAYDVPDGEWPEYVKARYAAVRAADGVARESRRADGRVLLYKCLGLPLGGRMLTYFDITDQKRVEKELANSKRDLELRVRELELLRQELREERDRAIRAAAAIAENRELLSEAIENVNEAIMVWGEDGKLMIANRHIRHIFPDLADLFRPGLALGDMIRVGFKRGIFLPPGGGDVDDLLAQAIVEADAGPLVEERLLGDGRWVRLNRRNTKGGKWVVTVTDITTEKESVLQITELASRDPLTGLANRRAFDDALARHLNGLGENDRIGVLLVDLDNFKSTNDEHGHPAGDAVLKVVATRLNGCLRKSDLAARIGGDEFAAIVTDVENEEALAQLAARIVTAMFDPVPHMGRQLSCGVSVGAAHSGSERCDPEGLIARADRALYAAKEAGRGTARVYSSIDPPA